MHIYVRVGITLSEALDLHTNYMCDGWSLWFVIRCNFETTAWITDVKAMAAIKEKQNSKRRQIGHRLIKKVIVYVWKLQYMKK